MKMILEKTKRAGQTEIHAKGEFESASAAGFTAGEIEVAIAVVDRMLAGPRHPQKPADGDEDPPRRTVSGRAGPEGLKLGEGGLPDESAE